MDGQAKALEITAPGQLRGYGLKVKNLQHLRGTLVYEAPVALGGVVQGNCRIGAYSYLGGGARIRNTRIGRYCSIGKGLEIGHPQHPTDWVTSHPMAYDGTRHFDFHEGYREIVHENPELDAQFRRQRFEIGNDVWIGDRVALFNSSRIGDGAVAAFGAVISKPVPAYEIWGGVPAERISTRFRGVDGADPTDLGAALQAAAWWQYCPRAMRERGAPMTDPVAFLDWLETHAGDLPPFRPTCWKVWREGETVLVAPAGEA